MKVLLCLVIYEIIDKDEAEFSLAGIIVIFFIIFFSFYKKYKMHFQLVSIFKRIFVFTLIYEM